MEKKFDCSSFVKVLWRLMLPIVLQNLLSAVVSTADVLMLTHVSQAALSASSLAGQVTFVLTLFYFGLSTGASVLAAQYWGNGDAETISRVQGLALRYSCAVSFLFFLVALLMPESLMSIFTQDELLIAYGAGYLRFVSLSYLAAFVWCWPPLAVYAVLCMDEFVKLPFVAARFRQYKWLKNLTYHQVGENTNVQNL